MIIIELIYNLSVLVALSILSGFIDTRFSKTTSKGKIFQGMLFGATAIIGMMYPFVLTEGLIFDGRSIVISLCTLFFGPVSGLIASAAAIIYRLAISGSGALIGVLVILSSFTIGLIFHHSLVKSAEKKITKTKLYLFGVLVHIVMLVLFLWLPFPNFMDTYIIIATTVIVFYPFATLLIGKILLDQEENQSWSEKIKASELRFRSVWENSADGMRLTNSDGIIVMVNKALCDMVGMDKKDIEGNLLSAIYRTEKHEDIVKKHVERFISKTVEQNFEREMTLWSGKKIWFEVTNSFIEIENQQTMLLSIYRDISTRKQSEIELIEAKEKAEEMNRLKTNFLANLSHELRTPMIGILGYADILTEELSKPEHHEMIRTIRASGERLLRTLNMLLDLSRVESVSKNFQYSLINISTSVEKIIESFDAYAKNKNLELKAVIEKPDIYASLDERIFDQILNNLINNALKFTFKGGVTVSVTSEINDDEQWAVIKVIDTGIGISTENINIIFDEFRQVSEGLSRSYEGSGLGLTITKRSVELMKGNISVESREGIGSTFVVRFPLAANGVKSVQFSERASINSSQSINKDYNILIVENDRISNNFMNYILRNYGTLDFAEDGKTAIRLASEKKYAIILMDIGLGFEMNGVQATAEIRKLSGYKDTTIIAVTSYAMKGDREYFLSNGFTNYLSKPYERKELIEILEKNLK